MIARTDGCQCIGWAASLQHNYAPELNVVGWAFGGTPANLTAALQNLEGTHLHLPLSL